MALNNPGPAVSSSTNTASGLSATWIDQNGSTLKKPDGTSLAVQPFGSNNAYLAARGPISMACVGDSISAGCMGSFQDMGFLANLNPPFLQSQFSNWYETSKKSYQFTSWITFASMRTDGALYPFEYCYGYGGQGSVTILNKVLPVLLQNPYGLPDCAALLVGTNDGPTGQNLTAVQVGANLKLIIQQLLAAGVLPFLCQLLPRPEGLITFTGSVGGAVNGTISTNTATGTTTLTAGTYPITFSTGEIRYGTSNGATPSVITWSPAIAAGSVTQCEYADTFAKFIDGCNLQIARLAQEFQIPHVPFYDRIANGHGTWAHTRMEAVGIRYTTDGVHPTPIGCMIMGKVLAETFQAWFKNTRRANIPVCINDTSKTYQNQNQNLTLYTGTLNATSSTPTVSSAGGWQYQPAQLQLGRIIDSTFSEAGIGHTMQKTTSSNNSEAPIYEGYAWNWFGDGVNPISCQTNVINVSPGDRIAFAFQYKFIPDLAAASPGNPQFTILSSVLGSAYAGFLATGGGTVDPIQIGGEPDFESAFYYQEFTMPVTGTGTINGYYQYNNFAGTSNANDNVYIANVRIINLTTGKILSP